MHQYHPNLDGPAEPVGLAMAMTHKQSKRCADWLAFCLSIGWRREQLDALEALWWRYYT